MLLFSNLPHNFSASELHAWIESKGISALSIRIVRDSNVGGFSPAFGDVELERAASVSHAVSLLNGLRIQGRIIQVRETAAAPPYIEKTFLAGSIPNTAMSSNRSTD